MFQIFFISERKNYDVLTFELGELVQQLSYLRENADGCAEEEGGGGH